MVLVDTDTVEAALVGKLQLIQVVVIGLVADSSVEQFGRRKVHPDAVIAISEIIRQLRVRHQVEEVELHAFDKTSTLVRNLLTAARLASKASANSMWPASGTISLDARGIIATNSSA